MEYNTIGYGLDCGCHKKYNKHHCPDTLLELLHYEPIPCGHHGPKGLKPSGCFSGSPFGEVVRDVTWNGGYHPLAKARLITGMITGSNVYLYPPVHKMWAGQGIYLIFVAGRDTKIGISNQLVVIDGATSIELSEGEYVEISLVSDGKTIYVKSCTKDKGLTAVPYLKVTPEDTQYISESKSVEYNVSSNTYWEVI